MTTKITANIWKENKKEKLFDSLLSSFWCTVMFSLTLIYIKLAQYKNISWIPCQDDTTIYKTPSLYSSIAINKDIICISFVTSLSPCLGLLAFLGKTINLLLYSFSLCTFAWRDSADLFFLLWSTEIPMVGATLREMPAAWKDRRN